MIALSAVACTGSAEAPPTSGSPASPSGGGLVASNIEVRFKPGAFRYSFNDVTATLTMDGSTATMEVRNGSGADLDRPGVYAITGDDRRFDADVADARGVADGGEASFRLMFPDDVTAQTATLIVLLFGDSNYGAFAPVAVAAPSASASG